MNVPILPEDAHVVTPMSSFEPVINLDEHQIFFTNYSDPTEHGLLSKILHERQYPQPKLAYADYINDRGQEDRANVVRFMVRNEGRRIQLMNLPNAVAEYERISLAQVFMNMLQNRPLQDEQDDIDRLLSNPLLPEELQYFAPLRRSQRNLDWSRGWDLVNSCFMELSLDKLILVAQLFGHTSSPLLGIENFDSFFPELNTLRTRHSSSIDAASAVLLDGFVISVTITNPISVQELEQMICTCPTLHLEELVKQQMVNSEDIKERLDNPHSPLSIFALHQIEQGIPSPTVLLLFPSDSNTQRELTAFRMRGICASPKLNSRTNDLHANFLQNALDINSTEYHALQQIPPSEAIRFISLKVWLHLENCFYGGKSVSAYQMREYIDETQRSLDHIQLLSSRKDMATVWGELVDLYTDNILQQFKLWSLGSGDLGCLNSQLAEFFAIKEHLGFSILSDDDFELRQTIVRFAALGLEKIFKKFTEGNQQWYICMYKLEDFQKLCQQLQIPLDPKAEQHLLRAVLEQARVGVVQTFARHAATNMYHCLNVLRGFQELYQQLHGNLSHVNLPALFTEILQYATETSSGQHIEEVRRIAHELGYSM